MHGWGCSCGGHAPSYMPQGYGLDLSTIDLSAISMPSFGKDPIKRCADAKGDVAKWSSAKPSVFNTASGIARKLAEAKEAEARWCAEADRAAAVRDSYSTGIYSTPAPNADAPSVLPWLVAGGAGVIAVVALALARRRR